MDPSVESQLIVSDPSEQLILVDSGDEQIGTLSKAECHAGAGVLHRAFSVFLFNSRGELLMQQRSSDKELWPLFWSNSCCSHPRYGESMEIAVGRRMREELGVECTVSFLYKFQYQAFFADVGAEHEVCSVFYGIHDGPVEFNITEVAAVRYLSPQELDLEIERNPDQFTPWFKLEWDEIRQDPNIPGRQ